MGCRVSQEEGGKQRAGRCGAVLRQVTISSTLRNHLELVPGALGPTQLVIQRG